MARIQGLVGCQGQQHRLEHGIERGAMLAQLYSQENGTSVDRTPTGVRYRPIAAVQLPPLADFQSEQRTFVVR